MMKESDEDGANQLVDKGVDNRDGVDDEGVHQVRGVFDNGVHDYVLCVVFSL